MRYPPICQTRRRRLLLFFQLFITIFFINVILRFSHTSSFFKLILNRDNGSLKTLSEVSEGPNFSSTFLNFPWTKFEQFGLGKDLSGMDQLSQKLVNELTPFLVLEPHPPINFSCLPPPLDNPEQLLNCTLRTTPARIGLALQFGFEVDTLEVHLNELSDLVDKFFIVESTQTHYQGLRKPLIWDKVKGQARFSPFMDQVVHIVVDDVDVVRVGGSGTIPSPNSFIDRTIWKVEDIQETVRWERFLQWNNVTNFFGQDDLIGFGDADEVASRRAVNHLKHCVQPITPLDIGIWFPFGNIHQAYASDFPVPDYPFSLGDPTFWSLKAALGKNMSTGVPSRMRGKSPAHLLGGMHMSYYGYLPLRMVSKLTATEGGLTDLSRVKEFSDRLKEGKVLELETELAQVPGPLSPRVASMHASRLEELKVTKKRIAVLPWFYDCNRKRYPSWEGGHDTRVY